MPPKQEKTNHVHIQDGDRQYRVSLVGCGIQINSQKNRDKWYYTKKYGHKVELKKKKVCRMIETKKKKQQKQKEKEKDKKQKEKDKKKKEKDKNQKQKDKKASTKKKKSTDTRVSTSSSTASSQKDKKASTKKKKSTDTRVSTSSSTASSQKEKKKNVSTTKRTTAKKTGSAKKTGPAKKNPPSFFRLKSLFMNEQKKIAAELKIFLETAEECNSGDYMQRLRDCFDKGMRPMIIRSMKKNLPGLLEKDDDGSYSILAYLENELESVYKCMKTTKRKCKVSDSNLELLETELEQLTTELLDEAAAQDFEAKMAGNTTYEDAVDYILSRVGDTPLPTVAMVRERLGDSEAINYKGNLERIQDSEIRAFQSFEPTFMKTKLMNSKTLQSKLKIIGLMSSSDLSTILDFMEQEKEDKTKKRKQARKK